MVAAGRKKKSIAILVTRSFGKRYCDANSVYIYVYACATPGQSGEQVEETDLRIRGS